MKIFFKVLFAIAFLNSFVFGATSGAGDETQFTEGKNQRTDCQIECPPMKEGYIARMNNFNYETGETVCNAYDIQNIYHAVALVSNQNPYCSKDLINPVKTTPINTSTSLVNSNLENLRNDIKSFYTAGSTTYINLPKYMVAGLMADDNIIDISSSISNNKVTLNAGYTYYPSLVTGDADGLVDPELVSFTKDALANSVTFVMNFFSISDKTLLSFKVTMFLFVVALSVLLAVSQKATKKASQLQDHEDITEKVLLGVGSILIFFLTLNKIETPNGQISQTGYQQLIRPMIYLGIDTADKLAENVTASVLKYKFGEVGYSTEKDLNNMHKQKWVLEQKQVANNLILKTCSDTYNVAELKSFNKTLLSNFTYPASEEITRKFMEQDTLVTFYTKKFMNSEELIKRGGVPTVVMCFNAEKNSLINKSEIKTLDKKIQTYAVAISSKELEKQINLLTNLTYRSMAEMGFISVVNVATTNIAFEHLRLDAFDKEEYTGGDDVEETIDDRLGNYRKATGYDVPYMARAGEDSNWGIEGVQFLIGNSPYLMLFGGIRDSVKDFLKPSPTSQAEEGKWSGKIVEMLLKSPLGKGVIKVLSFAKDGAVTLLPSIIAIALGMFVLSIAPLIAIMAGGFLVMGFYFLSIVILYAIIPFASVFAFSTGNLDIIKNLIKHTFLLSIKPILITVSVLISIFAYTMFNSFNETMIASMFEPLYALMYSESLGISNIDNAIYNNTINTSLIVFIKGVFHLASSVITTVACFYLVFNGANIMLDILGMRDGGFDVGGVIGDKVESKHGKLNHGV